MPPSWVYVVSGSCRTTLLSPEGAETNTFEPGDVWYFPRGWGHSIRGIGPSECRFILIFDDDAFAEDHTLSITDWLAHTSPAVVSQSLGLGMSGWPSFRRERLTLQGGPFLMTPSRVLRPSRSRHLQRRIVTHWGPSNRGAPGGGAQWTVAANEFPILTSLSASVLEIEPGAMRELHWQPHADEWQYYLEGAAEMAVYLGMGHSVTEQFVAGDIGYAPMGAGHYIRYTGSGILRMLIAFNNPHYRAHDLNTWLASNPPDVLAANLGLPRTVAETLPKETLFIARPDKSWKLPDVERVN